jgi:hypothetical protein
LPGQIQPEFTTEAPGLPVRRDLLFIRHSFPLCEHADRLLDFPIRQPPVQS